MQRFEAGLRVEDVGPPERQLERLQPRGVLMKQVPRSVAGVAVVLSVSSILDVGQWRG